MADGAAIRAARQQHHIGAQLANALYFFVRQAPVVGGKRVHDDRPGTQGAALGALAGHRQHYAGHHHLQPAASTARRDVDIDPDIAVCRSDNPLAIENLPPGKLLDLLNGVEYPPGDVLKRGLDRGWGLAAKGLAIPFVLLFDQDRLGRGTAAVGGDNYVEVIHAFGFRAGQ